MSTRKGTLGSGPTLPPASHSSQFFFKTLDCLTRSSKYWFNLICIDKALVPSTIVDIGFSALPNNFLITCCPTPVKSDKFLPPDVFAKSPFLDNNSAASDFKKKLGTSPKRTTPDLVPSFIITPLGNWALVQTELTIFFATSSESVTPLLAASSINSLTAILITLLLGP